MARIIRAYAYTTRPTSSGVSARDGSRKKPLPASFMAIKRADEFVARTDIPLRFNHRAEVPADAAQILDAWHDDKGMLVDILLSDDIGPVTGLSAGYTIGSQRAGELEELSLCMATGAPPANPDCRVLEEREAPANARLMAALTRYHRASRELMKEEVRHLCLRLHMHLNRLERSSRRSST